MMSFEGERAESKTFESVQFFGFQHNPELVRQEFVTVKSKESFLIQIDTQKFQEIANA